MPEEPTDEMLASANRVSLSTAVLLDDTRFACERAMWRAAFKSAPAPTPDPRLREVVARMIDGRAFNGFELGAPLAAAQKQKAKDAALAKADSILALLAN
jgi:hypothetical protein